MEYLTNGKTIPFLLKALVLLSMMFTGFFIGASRDWMNVTRQGAVDTARLNAMEQHFNTHIQDQKEFVRKDVHDAQIIEVIRRLDRIEQMMAEDRKERRR